MHPHLTASTIVRFWSHVDRSGSCWLWNGALSRTGYARMTIQQAFGQQRGFFVHRVSWQIAHGTIPNGLFVLHRCDIRHCVNPAHLFLGTLAENNADRHRKGRDAYGPRPAQCGTGNGTHRHPERVPRGDGHPHAKLTEAAVRQMRRRHAAGTTLAQLAREFGIRPATAFDAVRGRRWGHVT